MYHVFVVHSYITHLVAERVVEHERLEGSSVVFLTARNFSPARARYRCVPIDISPNPETFPRQRNVLDSWRRLRAWDTFWFTGFSVESLGILRICFGVGLLFLCVWFRPWHVSAREARTPGA